MTDAAGDPEPSRLVPAPARAPSPLAIALGIVDFAIAAWIGYRIAYEASTPGFLKGLVVVYGLGAILVVAGIVAIVGWLATRGRSSAVGRTIVALSGVFVIGSVAGAALTPALGLQYREPIVLEAQGTSNLELPAATGFTSQADAATACHSIADQQGVAFVDVNGAGLLDGARVLFEVRLDPAAGAPWATVSLGLETLGPDAFTPAWAGPVSLEGVSGSGLGGTARFDALALESDPKQPLPSGSWPTTLAGTFTWTCGAYVGSPGGGGPGSTLPAAPAPAPGTVDLELEGIAWTPIKDQATCDPGGVSGPVGTLQGYGFTVQLSLNGAVVGGHVNLSIVMDLGASKNPPAGIQFAPSWTGDVPVVALGPGGRSGKLEFTDLATGVDPAAGPAPTGWPTTISGSLTWDCAPGA
jgi:drug/metabolite transporter superfamily protein YnfA